MPRSLMTIVAVALVATLLAACGAATDEPTSAVDTGSADVTSTTASEPTPSVDSIELVGTRWVLTMMGNTTIG
jgi:ABC-type glycerol-3-phosphate transport system substrate-binding protein